MATVDLTLEQILSAVEQLSPAERKRLQRELTRRELSAEPAWPRKRMSRRQTRRMSELLLKANSAALTSKEDAELNALVDEFESLTLAGAEALAQSNKGSAGRAGGLPRSTKG
jgi:hypothetical protein